jgi:hypothetical protein
MGYILLGMMNNEEKIYANHRILKGDNANCKFMFVDGKLMV